MLKKILLVLALWLGELCFGLVFVVIFVNATIVNCALQADESYTCEIRTLFLGQVKLFDRKVEHIVGIRMEDDGCSDGCAYRAEFVTTTDGQVPLSEVYTDQGPVQQQVATLSAQIGRQVAQINYTVEPPWWVLFLVGGMTVLFMVLSLFVLRPG